MEKTIKYVSIMFITLLTFFISCDIVKADGLDCTSKYSTKETCEGSKDDNGNVCGWVDVSEFGLKSYCHGVETNTGDDNATTKTGTTNKIKTSSYLVKANNSFKCSDVKYLTGLWMLLRIVSPFIVILFGSLDFFKAMIASDEKKMAEARGKFPKRLIAFLLLIFLPFMIQFIFNHIGTYGSQNTCLVKCIVTNNTSSKGCE